MARRYRFEQLARRETRRPRDGFKGIRRLAAEPRRMWRRYLLGNPTFLSRALDDRGRRLEAGA